ncbi:hypothetical protein F383_30276 [Gossypium arboreum]|uniref:Uncharacterized protein n=1 Tax=Gossypium arboreum TaxID=29729 RepID=A0A0B0MPL1_GOSAR|nr:hypothetical protein F383_30276 [Gossypium arboreum]
MLKLICLFVYDLLSFRKLTLCVFSLFYRYRSYRQLGDHRGLSPHYQSLLWYLLKVYILKHGMYRLEVIRLCFVICIDLVM